MKKKVNVRKGLAGLGLDSTNAVVIGSGILQVLRIRESKDIDLVVTREVYRSLKDSGKFTVTKNHKREILKDDLFEIGTNWNVLGEFYEFKDFGSNSVMIDGVRYITLDFLYRVKESWLREGTARLKDINDLELIEKFREG